MPRDITREVPLDHLQMGLRDSDAPDVSIIADKVVDITDLCSMGQIGESQVVFKYGQAIRGRIIQIQDRCRPGEDSGVAIHFFYEESGVAGLVAHPSFAMKARILGCDCLQLAETIFDFQPEEDSSVGTHLPQENITKRPLDILFAAIGKGEIREEIPCEEARREWFIMARQMYVEGTRGPRPVIDYEIGLHLGRCAEPACGLLAEAYKTMLKPSQQEDSTLLEWELYQLEHQVFPDTAQEF